MVAIVLVSILLLTVVLWKLWRLVVSGAFRRDKAEAAVRAWTSGDMSVARGQAGAARGIRGRVVGAAFAAVSSLPEAQARAETERVARRELAELRTGFRLIELIALVAPLLGLLGTVLGMIAAFQALEASGGAADPATLAGGIWEALMTTAAGMVVAIPASLALGLFEGIEERVRIDLEDLATRIFTARSPVVLAQAAE
jgi:biopolymer transport protein ExbB